MTPTETGMYGPGDYPADFVTLEEQDEKRIDLPIGDEFDDEFDEISVEVWRRRGARDPILDLAKDLDERGLFLTRINVVERDPIVIEDDADERLNQQWEAGYYVGFDDGIAECPNTANADVVTGGEE